MSIKFRLTLMNFFQLFVWGAWLTTLASYGFGFKQWSGQEFGIVFSTLGIASIIMPAISGIIADKFMNLEKLYGLHHILYGITLLIIPNIDNASSFFWVMLFAMIFYMPTLSLSNALSYTILKNNDYDVVKVYPPIRVFGTIGFIVAMWITNLVSDPESPLAFGLEIGNKLSNITGMAIQCNQFYIAAFFAILLGIYSMTLPKCPPKNEIDNSNVTLVEKLGLQGFKLFKQTKMATFFIFSIFLGAALQLTNMYGETYIKDFSKVPEFADTFAVKSANIVLSISQISETIFILAIPFFLKRFGIKKVMLFSLIAWVLRFGFFAYGDPINSLWMIIMSNIVYGFAFDFFNISGSLFVETTTDSKIRSSAQGLFMMMTNGFGAVLGSLSSGYLIDNYFTYNDVKDWHNIWLTFAIYALVITVLFAIFFKHKHNPNDVESINH
ncbi:nucleoside permease [Flavobacterium chungnamense]|uniref:Nucleoside permease n=1 Tax=Flavobacterium chungnamense TaxID=706182 RepID=A0ABP7UW79_9FLAO